MPPVVDLAERALIPVTAADDGMMIYLSDGTTRCVQIYNATDAQWVDFYCMPVPPPPYLTYYQDFESAPATPTLTYSGGSGSISSGNGSTPSTPMYSEGAQGYEVSNVDSTISFDAIDTSGFTNIDLSFDLASFSTTTGNGAESSDIVEVLISMDNATWSSEVIVSGFDFNARWDFSGTAIASGVYDGDNTATAYSATSGGTLSGADAYSKIALSGLPITPTLYIQIRMMNSDTKEIWVIDNVILSLN